MSDAGPPGGAAPSSGESPGTAGDAPEDDSLAETLSNRVDSTRIAVPEGETVGSLSVGVTAATVTVALALVTGLGGIYLLGLVGVGYSALAWLTSVPETDLQVRRELDVATAFPGDTVTVRVTAKNVGEQTMTDLRVFDGVPEALSVVDGSPSVYTGLRPGEATTFSYTLRAKRGVHPFTETTLIVRDGSGTSEAIVECALDTEITCRSLLEDLPLPAQTLQRVGQVSTDEGGDGVEFFATREYRHGDPQSRIDWNRLAKTGSLTTIEYREQRVVTVAILVDDRPVAERAVDERGLEALDLGIYAAERALEALTADGNRTALLRLSTNGAEPVSAGRGQAHAERVRSALRERSDTFADVGTDESTGRSHRERGRVQWSQLERQLPTNGQVLFVSPALDDAVLEVAENVAASGREITLLSPDVTVGDSPGHRMAALDRAVRLEAIRETGTRVVDWHPETAVQVAVSRALALWRQ